MRRRIMLVSMLAVALVPSVAEAHRSPGGCISNSLDLRIERDRPVVRVGEAVTFRFFAANPGVFACDITAADVYAQLPGANGQPMTARRQIFNGLVELRHEHARERDRSADRGDRRHAGSDRRGRPRHRFGTAARRAGGSQRLDHQDARYDGRHPRHRGRQDGLDRVRAGTAGRDVHLPRQQPHAAADAAGERHGRRRSVPERQRPALRQHQRRPFPGPDRDLGLRMHDEPRCRLVHQHRHGVWRTEPRRPHIEGLRRGQEDGRLHAAGRRSR